MVSTTYGRAAAVCVDPIELKPLFHFYPGSASLSLGTAGCHLACGHCTTWLPGTVAEDLAASRPALPEGVASAARALGVRCVAFTFNDPVVCAEYAIDTARACRAAGLKTVAVTSGYLTAAARAEFFSAWDAVCIDLKGSERFYREQCGGHLDPVRESIAYAVRETQTWVELTRLVIPGLNDSDTELDQTVAWIGERLGPEIPLHLHPFRPAGNLVHVPATQAAALRQARRRAIDAGLHNVYVPGVDETTFCRGCGARLVERRAGKIAAWTLIGGECQACGRAPAGHFDEHPGTWEGTRIPVVVSPSPAELPRGPHELG